MDKKTIAWIKATLSNDENSSDEELVTYFMEEGQMSEAESRIWVAKRDFYMMNLVVQDDEGDDIGIFAPNTRTIKPL